MEYKYPIAWMNGTPRTCTFCQQPLKCEGQYVHAYQSSSGKLYCTEFCASDEEDSMRRIA